MYGFRKAGAKSRGKEDVRRAKKRAEQEYKLATDSGALVNPYDHMNMDQKKESALSICKRRLQVIILSLAVAVSPHFAVQKIWLCLQEAVSSGKSISSSKARINAKVAAQVHALFITETLSLCRF